MSPRRRILPIFVPHAGCPNQCVFCDQKRISGSPFSASAAAVQSALSALPAGAGVELAFYGGSFTAIPTARQEELLSAAIPFRENGTVSSIRVSTRPDAVDPETISRMLRFGVETVELGAQSMDDEVLRLSGRGHTARDTEWAAEMVKGAGLHLILQMMTGLPGSTGEKDMESARRIIALRPEGARIYPTVILRGTELERMWQRGEYKEHTVEDAVELCSRILPLFEQAGISVIRLGLNPSDALSAGEAVAGAYHPALGELVRSRILRREAEELLRDAVPGTDITILVPAEKVSAMTGQHRCNLRYLEERFSLRSVRVKGDPEVKEEISLL